MLTSAIEFAGELLEEISPKFFESDFVDYDDLPEQFCSKMVNSLYEAEDMKTAVIPDTDGRELLSAGFATVLRLAQACAKDGAELDRSLLPASLRLLETLAEAAGHSDQVLGVNWLPFEWTGTFIALLGREDASTKNFEVHSVIIRSMLVLSKMPTLSPEMELNDRSLVQSLTDKVSHSLSLESRC